MIRHHLYRTASIIGDVEAIRKGRFAQRLARKVIYGRSLRAASWFSRLLKVAR